MARACAVLIAAKPSVTIAIAVVRTFDITNLLFLFSAVYLDQLGVLRCPILGAVYASLRFLSSQIVIDAL